LKVDIMRTHYTARGFAASAAAVAFVVGGTLSSASAVSSDSDRDRDRDRNRAWVEVCQRVDDGRDRDRDDRRDFRGRYTVEDERNTYRFTLRGRYDCERVEVRAGRIRVSVVSEPRGTDLRGRDHFRFRIDRGDFERVTFRYRQDDRDRGGDRVAA
jgi:hypothetical protein